jgi:aldehyde dehydrogenase (NAD+)
MKHFGNFIGGEWIQTTEKINITNPYTNDLIGTVPSLSGKELSDAVQKASSFRSNLTAYERYEILINTAETILERKDEISRLISFESGICLKSTRHEIDRTYQALIFSAEEAKRLEGTQYPGDIIPGVRDKFGITIYQPVGLILAITPFNHPMNQVVHKVGPGIAANNTIVLKPSSKTPLTAIKFVEILLESGLPKEMITLITCDMNQHGDELVGNPLFDMVTFTGSTEVGERIHNHTGIKKALFELGGNGVLMVLEDSDIDEVATIACKGAFSNSGQRCTSIKRILLQNSVADSFINAFKKKTSQLILGDPFDSESDLGTVIDENAAINIEKRIKDAVDSGAYLVMGGNRVGAAIEPTILDHVLPEMEIVKKETFGPTAPIIRFDTIKEAIEIANRTEFGLQAGVCTKSIDTAMYIAKALKVGAVMINEGPGFRIEQFPFGGIKKSGLGREGVKCAIREMSHLKLIVI